MPTPLRKEIQNKPVLRKTKRSMPSPLRLAIEAKPILRKTKRTLPTPIREAIKQRKALRATKKSLPIPLLSQIQSKPALRKTKPTLSTPLREEIKAGVTLRHTKKSLPMDLKAEIESKPRLKHVPLYPPTKRGIDETFGTPVTVPPAKKRRLVTVASPLPYNFHPFVKPGAKSPAEVALSGIRSLFHSPKTKFSADPAEMFEAKLFGQVSNELVTFASPLALTAKKPIGPTRRSPMPSRLKNAGDIPVFDLGVCEPKKTRARNTTRQRNTRKIPKKEPEIAITRVTRSRSKKTEDSAITKPTKSAEKVEVPPVRKTRSGTKRSQPAPTKPAEAETPPTTTRTTRARTKMATAAVEMAVKTRSRPKKSEMTPTEPEAPPTTTHTTRSRFKKVTKAPETEMAPICGRITRSQGNRLEITTKPKATTVSTPQTTRSRGNKPRVATPKSTASAMETGEKKVPRLTRSNKTTASPQAMELRRSSRLRGKK